MCHIHVLQALRTILSINFNIRVIYSVDYAVSIYLAMLYRNYIWHICFIHVCLFVDTSIFLRCADMLTHLFFYVVPLCCAFLSFTDGFYCTFSSVYSFFRDIPCAPPLIPQVPCLVLTARNY